jgi:DNA-binding NtrC family response regulator
MRKGIASFAPGARVLLQAYAWPGNIRELKNVVERAVVLCAGEEIEEADLPLELRRRGSDFAGAARGPVRGNEREAGPAAPAPGGSAIELAERALLAEAMGRCGGNISAAARDLGITRNTLRYRLRKYGP